MEDWIVKGGMSDGRTETFATHHARKIVWKFKYLRILFLVCFNTTKRYERKLPSKLFSIEKALAKTKVSKEKNFKLEVARFESLWNKGKWCDGNASVIIFIDEEHQTMSDNGLSFNFALRPATFSCLKAIVAELKVVSKFQKIRFESQEL